MMLSDYKRLNPVAQVRELREAQRRAHRAPTDGYRWCRHREAHICLECGLTRRQCRLAAPSTRCSTGAG